MTLCIRALDLIFDTGLAANAGKPHADMNSTGETPLKNGSCLNGLPSATNLSQSLHAHQPKQDPDLAPNQAYETINSEHSNGCEYDYIDGRTLWEKARQSKLQREKGRRRQSRSPPPLPARDYEAVVGGRVQVDGKLTEGGATTEISLKSNQYHYVTFPNENSAKGEELQHSLKQRVGDISVGANMCYGTSTSPQDSGGPYLEVTPPLVPQEDDYYI